MTTVVNGVIGGAIVGLLAGLVVVGLRVRMPSANSATLGPLLGERATQSWTRLLGGGLVYGAVGGGVLVALVLFVGGGLGVPPSTAAAFGVAILWAALLFAGVVLLSRRSDGAGADEAFLRLALAFHVVYGLGLGLWIRLTWIT